MKRNFFYCVLSFILALSLSLPLNFLIFEIAAEDNTTIYINEVCSSNKGENGNLTDQLEQDGSYPDWIELYNPNSFDVNLSGWGISDNKDEPFKGTLENATIKATGYLIVYCSKAFAGNKLNVSIGISKDGEPLFLTNKNSVLIDTINLAALESDFTYGRIPNGSDNLCIMYPSPGATNAGKEYAISPPEFSKESGFYDNEFQLNISCPTKDVTIYYTKDGSNPLTSKTKIKYTGAITVKDRTGDKNVLSAVAPNKISANPGNALPPNDNDVDKGTVIRAYAVSNDNTSNVITKSYFVGPKFSKYKNISVLSVATDYENLYDHEKGIYVLGKTYQDYLVRNPGETRSWILQANFNQKGRDWERDCHIEYFDTDGELKVAQNCGIRTQGNASKDDLQKAFRFFARKEYGQKYFNHEFLPNAIDVNGDVVSKYKTFVVRGGGNETQYMKFTDNYFQSLATDRACDVQQGKPCVVFIDGEYWGVYVLQEDYDNDYFEQLYSVDKNEVVVIKNGSVNEGQSQDITLFNQLKSFFQNNNMTDDANYKKACEMVDMQSFIDYMALQMYICNKDWPHNNIALWRTRTVDDSNPYADGRWRFLVFDTESAAGLYGGYYADANRNRYKEIMKMENSQDFLAIMVNRLLRNNDFKKQLTLSFFDMINVNFNANKAVTMLDQQYNFYYPHLVDHFKRFKNSDISKAVHRYEQVRLFMQVRSHYSVDLLKSAIGLKGQSVNVNINANNANEGTVLLNTTTIDFTKYSAGDFSGKYYTDYPITLTAQSKTDYAFTGWTGDVESKDRTITVDLTDSVNLTANFALAEIGDINGDGNVNSKDSLELRRYLANWGNEISLRTADVTGDGNVNSKDSLHLKKHLANWGVELG